MRLAARGRQLSCVVVRKRGRETSSRSGIARWGVALVVGMLLAGATACSSGSSSDDAGSPTTRVLAPGEHAIGVREGAGGGEFFDKRTGEVFRPRGFSYLRIGMLNERRVSLLFRPDTFSVDATGADLAAMRDLGFNTVRVFMDQCEGRQCIVTPDGALNGAYLDNMATFLRLAADNGLQVILASARLPEAGYSDRLPCCDPFGGGRNSLYFTAEGVLASQEYWRNVLTALRERDARLDTVLGYELRQEQSVFSDKPPLSLTSGTVTTANGQQYDMSDPDASTRLVEDNVLHYIEQVRTAILELDPNALVTMGFFVPHGPNPARQEDTRVVHTARLLRESKLDFFDLHAYPGAELNLAQTAENFGLTGADDKPIILGEIGGIHVVYPAARYAASAIVDWQVQSCTIGVDGWLVWRWEDSVSDIYGSLAEGGIINQATAPANRPDPCVFGDVVPQELATHANVSASGSEDGHPPGAAIDDLNTYWAAGGPAPQSIELDFGTAATIREIRLWLGPMSAGATSHRVVGITADGQEHPLAILEHTPGPVEWLEQVLAEPTAGIQRIRIETTTGAAAAWREIQVFGDR